MFSIPLNSFPVSSLRIATRLLPANFGSMSFYSPLPLP